MSGDTLYERPRRHHVAKMRVHDYLYDSVFIVSSARDYARTAFKAAMESAQLCIQPVYSTMFSELRKFPRMQVVYHPNCRLPDHMDRSYGAYLEKVQYSKSRPTPTVGGSERFKFSAAPKKVLCMPSVSPQFCPPTPVFVPGLSNKPRNRGTQSIFRESSAQTTPWQPDGKQADGCEKTPEVLYLEALEWGPGRPYRIGDLPADFHTTEIINKMRHARTWHDVVEKGQFPRWMKKRDEIICDIETKDWIFREAEIDELQDIRIELLHRLQSQQRQNQTSRISKKLAKLWAIKKQEMEKKIYHIRHTRDRELRKLSSLHSGGGRQGQVARMRAARGSGSMTHTAMDPTSDLFAPLARHGYQARKRHAEIIYDPTLLSLEDHAAIAEPPAWLEQCGQDLKHTCSGHHLKRDPTQLCERETKWSEKFLENLHNDLKKARLGAASASPGPLHILKPRLQPTPRPSTPEVEAVDDAEEASHQSALLLQKVLRGRAVQCLMYEGRTRAAELTEELKTTHGLQKEDKIRITKQETKAREYNVLKTEAERKEDAITALVDELCGGAVAAALDFLEKELRRLKEERRQHAFILIAIREKTMREAAEAGRRQKEEHRRREHDEMFKQVLGVTQETVDAYLLEILKEGVELAAEEEAVKRAQAEAEKIDLTIKENKLISTAEENELVAELVHQFLLPNAHKTAARYRINALQQAKMDAARKTIFGLFDEAEIKQGLCTTCGCPLGEVCRCRSCPVNQQPIPTTSRDDPRWKHARRRPRAPEKTLEERYPPAHDFRCMLNTLIYEVVEKSRQKRAEGSAISYDVKQRVKEKTEAALDAREFVQTVLDRATGAVSPSVKLSNYRHTMKRIIVDALQRSEAYPTCLCPRELPSEIRQRAEEEAARKDPTCRCIEQEVDSKTNTLNLRIGSGPEDPKTLLPSELRILNELKRCKCDKDPHPTPDVEDEMLQYFEDTSGEETVLTDED